MSEINKYLRKVLWPKNKKGNIYIRKDSSFMQEATNKRIQTIDEHISLKSGADLNNQMNYYFYEFKDFKVGIRKPGKESIASGDKKNKNDSTPTIWKSDKIHDVGEAFGDIFCNFYSIKEKSIEFIHHIYQLFVRNAFLIDHKLDFNKKLRYSPDLTSINKINYEIKDVPIYVYLLYLELIALNEDVKYSTLPNFGLKHIINNGTGRQNNMLTYASILLVVLTLPNGIKEPKILFDTMARLSKNGTKAIPNTSYDKFT